MITVTGEGIQSSRIREEALSITRPILAQVQSLSITTPDSYATADHFLSKIREARKLITFKLSRIIDPAKAAVKAAKESLDAAKDFHAELDTPLESAERQLRDGMSQYKLEEARAAREAEETRLREASRLLEEARLKEAKEAAARTKQMRERLAAQRMELEAKAQTVAAAPVVAPVQVMNSTTRTVKKWRLVDPMAFVKAVAAGDVPLDAIDVSKAAVDAYFRADKELVGKWPGFEVYEEVQIVGR